MNDKKTKNKWNSIYADAEIKGQNASKGLQENAHLFSNKGRALDLACGTGGDAIFLSTKGFVVDAWDISDAIIKKLDNFATKNNLSINAEARDITQTPPESACYELISVAHYLDRSLAPILINALKPGGLLVYQTFTQEVTASYSGPSNLDFRLASNELLSLFSDLTVVVFREEGLLGDIDVGFRNESLLIAKKDRN